MQKILFFEASLFSLILIVIAYILLKIAETVTNFDSICSKYYIYEIIGLYVASLITYLLFEVKIKSFFE